jgi:thiamine pyrophosphokinase
MRTFLVAGSPAGLPPSGLSPRSGDRVIAVDLGASHARSWGWPVHLVIGDLDSLAQEDAAALAAVGIPMLVAPSAKDETDLELGLAQAIDEGAQDIIVCAALGGRTDHWLANILLLTRPDLFGRRIMIADGPQTVRVLHRDDACTDLARESDADRVEKMVSEAGVTLRGQPGDLLSLLPLGGDAAGVTTEGLLYPLRDACLLMGRARGVSNEFVADVARVWVRQGSLLIVHTERGGPIP